MKKEFIAIILAFFFGLTPLMARDIDKTTFAAHPRILLQKGDVTAMREFSHKSDNARLVDDKIMDAAVDILAKAPLSATSFAEGKSAWGVAQHIETLAYAFVMTEDMDYARRAERDMLAISNLGSWSAADSGAVAEFTQALALGYDWLYHSLPVHSRSIIGTAIYERGLQPLAAKTDAQLSDSEWLALLYGALATMERSPEFCEQVVRRAVAHCNLTLSREDQFQGEEFMPLNDVADMITCRVKMVAALQSASDEGCGLQPSESFMRLAEYLDFMVAPSFQSCNFGGAELSAQVIPAKYWFAGQRGDASMVSADEQLLMAKVLPKPEHAPLYMIFASSLDFEKRAKRANSWSSKGASPLYIYRSGWGKATDTYFAIKGGGASAAGRHNDGGAFIYEWGGVRWAVDPEGEKRGAEWHSTLRVAGVEHAAGGGATLTDSFTAVSRKGAVIDMTPLFGGKLSSATRMAELDKKDCLKITDHVVVGSGATHLVWQIMTHAKAEVAGPSVVKLSQDGMEFYLRLHSKNRSSIVIEDCGDDLKRVGFSVEVKSGQTVDIEVDLAPSRNNNVLSRLREKFKRGDSVAKR